jgi:hypothetical protein
MDFSKLNNLDNLKEKLAKRRSSTLDVSSFLNKADKLTHQVDSYFMEEPNELLMAMDKFDKSNDFAILEMEICTSEILKRNL